MKKSTKLLKSKYPETKFKTKFVDGARMMICSNSEPGNKYWFGTECDRFEKVGDDAVSVVCSKCICHFGSPVIERTFEDKSDKPKGWKFMKEFVDSEGNVYHKGVMQPELFGTLNPTVIQEKPEKKKLTKKEKEERSGIVANEIAALKQKLFTETRKTHRAALSKELNKLTKEFKRLV
jgi:hypothetical protein